MKKRTKIWLIAATVLVVVGSMTFAYAMTRSGEDFRALEGNNMEISNYNVGDSFDNIYIDTQTTDIDFFTWREPEVKVECTQTNGIKYDVRVEDSTLKIETRDERKWYEYISFFSLDMSLRVYLPGGAEYSSVVIHNTTGDVIIPEQIYTDSLEVKVTTGDIDCSARVTDTLKLKTTTGDIKLSGVNCSIINIKATTGDVILDGCDAKELDIRVTTGDVKGTLLSGKSFTANTTTGDIDIPDNTDGGACNIKATTGDIKIEIEPSA